MSNKKDKKPLTLDEKISYLEKEKSSTKQTLISSLLGFTIFAGAVGGAYPIITNASAHLAKIHQKNNKGKIGVPKYDTDIVFSANGYLDSDYQTIKVSAKNLDDGKMSQKGVTIKVFDWDSKELELTGDPIVSPSDFANTKTLSVKLAKPISLDYSKTRTLKLEGTFINKDGAYKTTSIINVEKSPQPNIGGNQGLFWDGSTGNVVLQTAYLSEAVFKTLKWSGSVGGASLKTLPVYETDPKFVSEDGQRTYIIAHAKGYNEKTNPHPEPIPCADNEIQPVFKLESEGSVLGQITFALDPSILWSNVRRTIYVHMETTADTPQGIQSQDWSVTTETRQITLQPYTSDDLKTIFVQTQFATPEIADATITIQNEEYPTGVYALAMKNGRHDVTYKVTNAANSWGLITINLEKPLQRAYIPQKFDITFSYGEFTGLKAIRTVLNIGVNEQSPKISGGYGDNKNVTYWPFSFYANAYSLDFSDDAVITDEKLSKEIDPSGGKVFDLQKGTNFELGGLYKFDPSTGDKIKVKDWEAYAYNQHEEIKDGKKTGLIAYSIIFTTTETFPPKPEGYNILLEWSYNNQIVDDNGADTDSASVKHSIFNVPGQEKPSLWDPSQDVKDQFTWDGKNTIVLKDVKGFAKGDLPINNSTSGDGLFVRDSLNVENYGKKPKLDKNGNPERDANGAIIMTPGESGTGGYPIKIEKAQVTKEAIYNEDDSVKEYGSITITLADREDKMPGLRQMLQDQTITIGYQLSGTITDDCQMSFSIPKHDQPTIDSINYEAVYVDPKKQSTVYPAIIVNGKNFVWQDMNSGDVINDFNSLYDRVHLYQNDNDITNQLDMENIDLSENQIVFHLKGNSRIQETGNGDKLKLQFRFAVPGTDRGNPDPDNVKTLGQDKEFGLADFDFSKTQTSSVFNTSGNLVLTLYGKNLDTLSNVQYTIANGKVNKFIKIPGNQITSSSHVWYDVNNELENGSWTGNISDDGTKITIEFNTPIHADHQKTINIKLKMPVGNWKDLEFNWTASPSYTRFPWPTSAHGFGQSEKANWDETVNDGFNNANWSAQQWFLWIDYVEWPPGVTEQPGQNTLQVWNTLNDGQKTWMWNKFVSAYTNVSIDVKAKITTDKGGNYDDSLGYRTFSLNTLAGLSTSKTSWMSGGHNAPPTFTNSYGDRENGGSYDGSRPHSLTPWNYAGSNAGIFAHWSHSGKSQYYWMSWTYVFYLDDAYINLLAAGFWGDYGGRGSISGSFKLNSVKFG